MAYLNSNSPLFSSVKEDDLREFTTIAPKLMSLIGEMENLQEGGGARALMVNTACADTAEVGNRHLT